MEIRFTPLASTDLEAIGDYIGQDNPARAYSFVLEIRIQCRKIASAPMTYKCRPEFGESIRSCAFGRYVILKGRRRRCFDYSHIAWGNGYLGAYRWRALSC